MISLIELLESVVDKQGVSRHGGDVWKTKKGKWRGCNSRDKLRTFETEAEARDFARGNPNKSAKPVSTVVRPTTF